MRVTVSAAPLLSVLDIRRGDRVLDVGDGLDATAAALRRAVGPEGRVIGVHPSLLPTGSVRRMLSGMDAVAAPFVTLPPAREARAVAGMAALLRRGGRFGIAIWSATIAAPSDLQVCLQRHIPSNVSVAEAADLQRTLRAAGLQAIDVTRRVFPLTLSADEYLRVTESSAEGQARKARLGGLEWIRARHADEQAFRARFGNTLSYSREAYLAVGTRPR